MSKRSKRSDAPTTGDPLRNLPILFEDESLVVVTKPAGMAVHGGTGEGGVHVIGLFQQARPECDLHLVHRLDKGTSGVLLLAKSSGVAKTLGQSWEQVRKTYLAVVAGRLRERRSINTPLVGRDGRPQDAQTDAGPIETIEKGSQSATVVRVIIKTGRLHQIRRHLAGIGYPILMDREYGNFGVNREWAEALRGSGDGARPKHPMLHASELSLPHPKSPNQKLDFRSSCPEAWIRMLQASGGSEELFRQLGHLG